jgi:hypothetical protein
MTTDNFGFYLQKRLIQTSQTGGQQYSDTSPFSISCLNLKVMRQVLTTVLPPLVNNDIYEENEIYLHHSAIM